MTASNVFSATSLSMLKGGRIVKVTLWPVCFSNSVAMAFAAICVDPTLSTRTSAAVARVDETMSVSGLTTIVRKDGSMMSSRNAAVVIARTNLHPREAIRYSITSSARASSVVGQRLDFSRGRLTFGGELTAPDLDFMAETKAAEAGSDGRTAVGVGVEWEY